MTAPDDRRSWTFWVGTAAGWGIMAAGVAGLLGARRTMPAEVARFVVGAAAVHDLVLAPFVGLVGAVLLGRLAPRARRAAATILLVVAPIALFAFPLVRGYGRRPGNPSVLPGNYASGLLITAVVAAVCVLTPTLLQGHRQRRGGAASSE